MRLPYIILISRRRSFADSVVKKKEEYSFHFLDRFHFFARLDGSLARFIQSFARFNTETARLFQKNTSLFLIHKQPYIEADDLHT